MTFRGTTLMATTELASQVFIFNMIENFFDNDKIHEQRKKKEENKRFGTTGDWVD